MVRLAESDITRWVSMPACCRTSREYAVRRSRRLLRIFRRPASCSCPCHGLWVRASCRPRPGQARRARPGPEAAAAAGTVILSNSGPEVGGQRGFHRLARTGAWQGHSPRRATAWRAQRLAQVGPGDHAGLDGISCITRRSSIGAGATYLPLPVLNRSLTRPVTCRQPCASMCPLSPVRSQPSSVMASRLSTGSL